MNVEDDEEKTSYAHSDIGSLLFFSLLLINKKINKINK